MAIVKVHNKARNVTYVYESVSYWDKELRQPRSHRKLIGRIDPATGDIVPTGKRGRSDAAAVIPLHSDTDYRALYEPALATIAQKDTLSLKLSIYRDLVNTAGHCSYRARQTEIKMLPAIPVADLQKQVDRMAKDLRLLDNLLQQTNWTTNLIEE